MCWGSLTKHSGSHLHSGISPRPPAPPRLQLVPRHKGLRCTGVVEFYNGSRGGTILYKDKNKPLGLGNFICNALQCGSFLTHLSEPEAAGTAAPRELRDHRPLPALWETQNGSCASLQTCFQKRKPQEGDQALTVICSGKLESDHTPSLHLSPRRENMGPRNQMTML